MRRLEASDLTIKVPWGYISGKTWGKATNTKVLMVHGSLDNAGTFNRLIEQLPQNMYYVCIDLPGHGLSSHFPPGVSLHYFDYVLSIKYVVDELNWEHFYYVGHSFGAHLGVFFSLIYPDKMKKLVLIDGCLPVFTIKSDQIISRIRNELDLATKSYRENKPPLYTKKEIIDTLMNPKHSTDRLTLEAAEALFERSVIKNHENLYSYNRDLRMRILIFPFITEEQGLYFLTKVKVDTLLIFATDGISHLKYLKPKIINILKNFNNFKIIEAEGNHDIHNNSPEKISSNISKFLLLLPSKL